jgi:hypothetical protein
VDQLVVVTHPEPLRIEARELEHDSLPEGNVALGYYHGGHILARGVVTPDAVDAIRGLLKEPISLALAATEDPQGNIEARVCLVLPFDPTRLEGEDGEDEGDAPWRASIPTPPPEIGLTESGGGGAVDEEDDEKPRLALLPIGHVIRGASDRRHANVVGDAREMLDNLVGGHARDAVTKAIDDLLDSL